MKKYLTILLLIVLTFSVVMLLCGCTAPRIEDKIEKVDGYYVYKHKGHSSNEDEYALFGAEDSKIVNGVLTIPETIKGLSVASLGYYHGVWDRFGTPVPMLKNDNIRKIVVNHKLTIYEGSFSELSNVVDLELNAEIRWQDIYSGGGLGCSPYCISIVNENDGHLVQMFNENSSKNLRTINRLFAVSINGMTSDNIIAYFVSRGNIIGDDFSKYESLSVFVVPSSTKEISQSAFKNTNIDVYVRNNREDCPEGMQNGWDEGVNVIWGFTDEIVIFDSLFGSPITFEQTGKNYQTAPMGSKLVCPEEPSREGYVFTGWYKDYALSEQWNFQTDAVQKSAVLVAGWQKTEQ